MKEKQDLIVEYLKKNYHAKELIIVGLKAVSNHKANNDWDICLFTDKKPKIRMREPPEKIKDEDLDIYTNSMDIGTLDVILASAGKGNAVNYLIQQLGYKIEQTIGIGDDINDIEILEATGKQYVLGNAYEEMHQKAQEKRWYISEQQH